MKVISCDVHCMRSTTIYNVGLTLYPPPPPPPPKKTHLVAPQFWIAFFADQKNHQAKPSTFISYCVCSSGGRKNQELGLASGCA